MGRKRVVGHLMGGKLYGKSRGGGAVAWRPRHWRTVLIFAFGGALTGLLFGLLFGASTYFGLMGFAAGSAMGAAFVAKIQG